LSIDTIQFYQQKKKLTQDDLFYYNLIDKFRKKKLDRKVLYQKLAQQKFVWIFTFFPKSKKDLIYYFILFLKKRVNLFSTSH